MPSLLARRVYTNRRKGDTIGLAEASAREAALLMEVVRDRSVDGSERLKTSHAPEPQHGPHPSPKRTARVLRPVVCLRPECLRAFWSEFQCGRRSRKFNLVQRRDRPRDAPSSKASPHCSPRVRTFAAQGKMGTTRTPTIGTERTHATASRTVTAPGLRKLPTLPVQNISRIRT